MTTTARPIFILAALLFLLLLAVPAMAASTGSNETQTIGIGHTQTVSKDDKTYVLTSVSHSAPTAAPPTEDVRFVYHQIK